MGCICTYCNTLWTFFSSISVKNPLFCVTLFVNSLQVFRIQLKAWVVYFKSCHFPFNPINCTVIDLLTIIKLRIKERRFQLENLMRVLIFFFVIQFILLYLDELNWLMNISVFDSFLDLICASNVDSSVYENEKFTSKIYFVISRVWIKAANFIFPQRHRHILKVFCKWMNRFYHGLICSWVNILEFYCTFDSSVHFFRLAVDPWRTASTIEMLILFR